MKSLKKEALEQILNQAHSDILSALKNVKTVTEELDNIPELIAMETVIFEELGNLQYNLENALSILELGE